MACGIRGYGCVKPAFRARAFVTPSHVYILPGLRLWQEPCLST